MQPKKQYEEADLFRSRLDQILNHHHPLYVLANQIDWSVFDEKFGPTYIENKGRPGKPTRLMVSLLYLKNTFDESDESVVDRFLENPYWQYFSGFEYFQHDLPIDPSSLTRFRGRIGPSGAEELLKELLNTARKKGAIKKSHMNRVNIDTTVQEKAIAFPTDARLYYKMRAALVRAARKRGIPLRQSYVKLAKETLAKQARYSHAKQFRRSEQMTRKLRTYLGRVYRDINRKAQYQDDELFRLLNTAARLLRQKKESKDKIYSIHAPEVECISKGKAHKRYEFGSKVGLATTSRGNWVVGIQAFHGNPYDGHTLTRTLEQVERLTEWEVKDAYVDLGYRGHGYEGSTQINIVNYRTMKKATRSIRKWLKRRASIEPVIGHLKSDNRMSRNYLKGREGDCINALLCGCGYNMRKLIAVFLLPYFVWRKVRDFINKRFMKQPEFQFSLG